MKIKLQYLEHFIAIAEYKGYRNASKHIGKTQAALSASMKELEKILGKELFTKGHKVSLTPLGKLCLPRAKETLANYQRLQDFMIDTSSGKIGNIRIGCMPSAVQNILPKILPPFTNDNPNVKISLIDNSSSNLYDKLLNNQIDLAIITKPKKLDKKVKFIPIHYDVLGVMCSKSNPLAKRKTVSFNDLKNQPFISNNITLFMNEMEIRNLNENAIHHVENVLSLNTSVSLNLGITIIGEMAMDKNNNDLVWIPLSSNINRVIGAMYVELYDNTPIIDSLLSYINDAGSTKS
ncbi:MAG: LysR family transcriptional regulator [Alphaproteobacteria bacterium]